MTIEIKPAIYEGHLTVTRGTLNTDGIPFDMLGRMARFLQPFESAILDNVEIKDVVDETGAEFWSEPDKWEPTIEILCSADSSPVKYYGMEVGLHLWFFYLDIPKDDPYYAEEFREMCGRLSRSFDMEFTVERDAHDRGPRYIFS
jgi:hypothetical protein